MFRVDVRIAEVKVEEILILVSFNVLQTNFFYFNLGDSYINSKQILKDNV
jgi:hypothetical protein